MFKEPPGRPCAVENEQDQMPQSVPPWAGGEGWGVAAMFTFLDVAHTQRCTQLGGGKQVATHSKLRLVWMWFPSTLLVSILPS